MTKEVTGVSHHLARLFDVPFEAIALEVAGINHLLVILRFDAGGRNGMDMVRDWLAEPGPFAHFDDRLSDCRSGW